MKTMIKHSKLLVSRKRYVSYFVFYLAHNKIKCQGLLITIGYLFKQNRSMTWAWVFGLFDLIKKLKTAPTTYAGNISPHVSANVNDVKTFMVWFPHFVKHKKISLLSFNVAFIIAAIFSWTKEIKQPNIDNYPIRS